MRKFLLTANSAVRKERCVWVHWVARGRKRCWGHPMVSVLWSLTCLAAGSDVGKEQELGTETLGKKRMLWIALLCSICGVWMERNMGSSAPQQLVRGASHQVNCVLSVLLSQQDTATCPPTPSYCTADELQLGLLTMKSILATREAAEPFLELSVGLDSLHIRTARLLAARGSRQS